MVVESSGPFAGRYLLAAARVAAYARELGEDPRVLATFTGAQLVGDQVHAAVRLLRRAASNAHQVLTADYVTTEDGTGVVHIAPAFGEEDKAVTDAAGIEVVNPVDSQGKFTAAGAAVRGLCTSSTRTSRSWPTSRRPGCCSAGTATSTRTRTAGAATPR